MRTFFLRLLSPFRRDRAERDLAAELEANLQLHIDDNLRAGMTPAEARRQALLRFGPLDVAKEAWRDRRGFPVLEHLARDLRHACRTLVRNPGLSIAAVFSLALGIGANTAIFSVTDALLLKSLPVRNPSQLVVFAGWASEIHQWMYFFTNREFEELRHRTTSFSAMATTWPSDISGFTVDGRPEEAPLHIATVSTNYFSMLGVAPVVGRSFAEGEAAVVISYGYWQRRFGMAGDVLGRTAISNGRALTIVGVAPRRFTGDVVGQLVDLWIPAPNAARAPVRVIARLKPGVSPARALAETRAVYRQMERDLGEMSHHADSFSLLPEERGISRPREHFAQPLRVLEAVVALVLLIACANVANLLLARGQGRRREIAIRLALGAGRGRIIRQLFLENLALASVASMAGWLLSRWGVAGLARIARTGPWAVDLDLSPDGRVLLYTGGLCLLTALLFGLAPALDASRVALYDVVKGAPRRGRFRVARLLVIAQVALSLVLVIGAGLFVRTLRNLKSQDFGFDHDHLLLVRVDSGPAGSLRSALTDDVLRRIRRLPGVRSSAASSFGLLSQPMFTSVAAPGRIVHSPADNTVATEQITPAYLATIGMRLLQGRDFTGADGTGRSTVIVNESLARRYFGRSDVTGRHLTWGGSTAGDLEIVGVVADAAYGVLRERDFPLMLSPLGVHPLTPGRMVLAVRTVGDDPYLPALLRDELRSAVPNWKVRGIESAATLIDHTLAIERMVAWLAGLFGGVALLLACLGLYGVMSYAAARRTGEIGIRMSLGATPAEIARLILSEAVVVGGAGIAIGIPVALAGRRWIATLLFGIGPADVPTIALSAGLLLTVAVAAAWLPARRAARLDPMRALRCE